MNLEFATKSQIYAHFQMSHEILIIYILTDFEMECDNVLENQTAGTLGTTVSSDLSGWKEEMEKRFGDDQKFIAELRARKEKDLDLGNEK
jgi:hypothetical protein